MRITAQRIENDGDGFSFEEVGYLEWSKDKSISHKLAVMDFLTDIGGIAIINMIKNRCSAAYQDGQANFDPSRVNKSNK